jgi:serine/threonine protein phosphatase 1
VLVDLDDRLHYSHQCIDPDRLENIYIVGDVPGFRSALEALLEELSVGADDLVVFVGNIVRKMRARRAELELLIECQTMITVRGKNKKIL